VRPQQLGGLVQQPSWSARGAPPRAGERLDAAHVGRAGALDASRNSPISAVERTCVPPHSSREYEPSPISTIRTTSPYFSPNSAIAPRRLASSSVVVSGRTRSLRRIQSLTRSSTPRAPRRSAAGLGEVEAQLVRADVGAGLADVVARALAQRRVQQVGGRVVAGRRVARDAVDARDDALARLSWPAAPRRRPPGPRRRARPRPTRAAQSPDSQAIVPASDTCPPPAA
jgi:hypothetical protein